MIGAYLATEHFAYPGWRLTVPGGPAGGHYKGFTHTQAAGTDLCPQDQYEQDREDGMSSHDPVHASPRNPRGVYRSSAEVPPRPNASGQAHTYRSFQTQRHPGTSVAPGSFPAPFEETDEDAFLSRSAETAHLLEGLGVNSDLMRAAYVNDGPMPVWGGDPIVVGPFSQPPVAPPQPGVVNQPPPTPQPLPPSPSVSAPVLVSSAPDLPIFVTPSPRPSPTVPTNEVVPLNDGSGNYVNVSTGQIVSASGVVQNPATGQLTSSSALSWLEQPSSFFQSIPNWGLLIGAAALASMFMGKHR